MVEPVHIISYNMQQYINALSITSAFICLQALEAINKLPSIQKSTLSSAEQCLLPSCAAIS
jgi:hypothetical protein